MQCSLEAFGRQVQQEVARRWMGRDGFAGDGESYAAGSTLEVVSRSLLVLKQVL